MSYTEYLRRKAAAAPIIIDTTPKKVDASFYTNQQRMKAAARAFDITDRHGVINNVQSPSTTGTGVNSHPATYTTKSSGGRIPDASMFTQYRGGVELNKDALNPSAKILIANSNDAGSISACSPIAGPIPMDSTHTVYTPNMVAQTAKGFTNTKHCKDLGRIEPHIENELGPSLFVDNMRHPNPSENTCVADCKPAIHTHPVAQPAEPYQKRPSHSTTFPVPSQDTGKKVGAALRKIPYVEKHHGNDMNVNRRHRPHRYKLSNAPPHLRLNQPIIQPQS